MLPMAKVYDGALIKREVLDNGDEGSAHGSLEGWM